MSLWFVADSKIWRTEADIYHDVQDFALDDSAQLSLRSIQLVMKTTQSAPGRTRVVVLDEVISDAEVGKLGLMIALQEKPAGVDKHLGLNQTDTGQCCLDTFQYDSGPRNRGQRSSGYVGDLAPTVVTACNDKSRFS